MKVFYLKDSVRETLCFTSYARPFTYLVFPYWDVCTFAYASSILDNAQCASEFFSCMYPYSYEAQRAM